MGKPAVVAGNAGSPGPERIKAIIAGFDTGANRRSAHLINLAMATLKDVILHGKSDDLRVAAATALLGLPPVQQRLEYMRASVTPPEHDPRRGERPALLGKRLRRLMDDGGVGAKALLGLLEQAEKEAGLPPFQVETVTNSR